MYILVDKVNEDECGERERGKDSRTDKQTAEIIAPKNTHFIYQTFK